MTDHLSIRVPALVAALALTLWPTACGDSDEGGGNATAGQGVTSTESLETELQAVANQLKKGFEDGDPKRLCALLTPRAQVQTAAQGDAMQPSRQGSGKDASCERTAAGFIESFGDTLHRELRVLTAEQTRDRAVANVEVETGNRYVTRFVKQNGKWKFDQPLLTGEM